MPLVFSYGTLQQEAVQLATFGRLLDGAPDILPKFAPALVPITDPLIVKKTGMTHYDNALYTGDPADQLAGTVLTLSDAEIGDADSYEQKAAYVRIEVLLKSGLNCWVYVDSRSRPPKTQNREE